MDCDATELKFLATRVECRWAGASPVVSVMKGCARYVRRQAVVVAGGEGMREEVSYFGGAADTEV